MPRSFLITKLHKWQDSAGVEDGMISDDDVQVTDACTERLNNDDQTVQVQNLSTKYNDLTTEINTATNKSDDDNNYSADCIGTS